MTFLTIYIQILVLGKYDNHNRPWQKKKPDLEQFLGRISIRKNMNFDDYEQLPTPSTVTNVSVLQIINIHIYICNYIYSSYIVLQVIIEMFSLYQDDCWWSSRHIRALCDVSSGLYKGN